MEQSNANLNTSNTMSGRSPLFWAARNGHKEVVKLLLERDDVNPDAADEYGRTPLCEAIENGHREW